LRESRFGVFDGDLEILCERRLRFSQATVRSTLDQVALAPSYLGGRACSRGAITAHGLISRISFIPQPISRYFGRVISVKTDRVTNHK